MKLFITGGTGFLGTELIKKLLAENHHVYVLVRSKKKLAALLETIPDVYHSRLEAVEGNISSTNLGIQEDVKESLKYTIDAFYHSAALLSFDPKDADKLYEVNYLGTKNTLEFAKEMGVSSYYYISTAYTLGKQNKALETLHTSTSGYHNAYEDTKSQGEHLVMSYSDKMKVSIFRPAIIVGHSQTGECDSSFGLYGFIKGIEVFNKRQSRSGKNTSNQRFRIVADPCGTQNIVPVDYVVDVLYAGLHGAENSQIYHITNPAPPTNLEIFQMICSLLNISNIDVVSGEQELSVEEELLNGFISSFAPYMNTTLEFSVKNTAALLKKVELSVLNMDKDMLERIIYGSKQREYATI